METAVRTREDMNDFTTGSIPKKLLHFMLPIFGSLVLQAMYGAVDLLVVGQFGTTAGLSGVSTGSNVLNMVTFTVTGCAMAVTILIGHYLGEKKSSENRATYRRRHLPVYGDQCHSLLCHGRFCASHRRSHAVPR